MVNQKTKEERDLRRKEVKDFMEAIGPFSVPAKVLAEKYGVTVDTIYDDRDFWIKKINFKKMDVFGKKVIMSIMKNLELSETMRADTKDSNADRLRAMGVSNQTAEVVTKLLENYGFKEKVAEKVQQEIKDNKLILEIVDANPDEIGAPDESPESEQ